MLCISSNLRWVSNPPQQITDMLIIQMSVDPLKMITNLFSFLLFFPFRFSSSRETPSNCGTDACAIHSLEFTRREASQPNAAQQQPNPVGSGTFR